MDGFTENLNKPMLHLSHNCKNHILYLWNDLSFHLDFNAKYTFTIICPFSTIFAYVSNVIKYPNYSNDSNNSYAYFCISALAFKMGQVIKVRVHFHANQ